MGAGEQFQGVIGRTVAESTPWWPPHKQPPAGSPNIVIVLLDDTGFAHFGCYGSTIETPNIDRLAANGLRYTNFHTTALCSPTRACLLTGRNHHSVGMRGVSNFDTGFPHMRGSISPHAATIAEMLREHGYATFAVGKWHLAPMHECSMAGPFDNWPLQRGFDRFYGFMQGETDQFHPELTIDNHHVDPPTGPEDGYHLSEDLVIQSMRMVRDLHSVRPDRPFFLYVAFGATHAPHQAPQAYLDKYRGRFDEGWDVARDRWFARQKEMGIVPPDTELAPRNPGVDEWNALDPTRQAFARRLQEAFAAFLDHTDAQIGRLADFLAELDLLDDTIFIVTSDNGASQEGLATGVMNEFSFFNLVAEDIDHIVEHRLDDIGGPHSHSNYPWGWAQAGNTPLKWYKQNTFGGGIRDPLVIHWPARIKDGGALRHQFHHVTDLVPTFLDVLEIKAPANYRGLDQMPVHGTSLAYTFDSSDVRSRKPVQYFEQFGHRGIWKDGWKAVTHHTKGEPFDDGEWELYHLDEDFSECRNLASEHPDVLRDLIDTWWTEAGRYGVLPLDDRSWELFGGTPRPGTPHAVDTYVYFPPVSHLPSDAAPRLGGRSWTITADLERPDGRGNGVIFAQGMHELGHTFYVEDGVLTYEYNYFGSRTLLRSPEELPTGAVTVSIEFERTGPSGDLHLSVNGDLVDKQPLEKFVRMMGSTGVDVGRDALSAVSERYRGPFAYEGTISKIVFATRGRRSAADVEAAQRTAVGTE